MNRRFFSLSCAAISLIVVALALPILIRPYWEAARHYQSALMLLRDKKYLDGIVEMRKSLSWRSPFNSFAEQSSRELYEISHTHPDGTISQRASEELWRGLQSSRSWYMLIPGVWRGISENSAAQLLSEKFPPPPHQIKEVHEPRVIFLWQWIAHASLALWVALLFVTIKKNFSPNGRILPGTYVAFFLRVGTILVLWLTWILSLYQA